MSGLVVALFVVTVLAVDLTTDRTEATESAAASSAENIAEIEGVTAAHTVFGTPPDSDAGEYRFFLRASDAKELGLEVPPGARAVTVNYDYSSAFPEVARPVNVEPSQETPPPFSQPSMLVIKTDNNAGTIERIRTAVIRDSTFEVLTSISEPRTLHEEMLGVGSLSRAQQYASLANIGIIFAALISVVSLAVSTTVGVIERRRALALLRLTGMPARKLRSMITIETAVPFASVFLLCVGLGAFVAWALVTSLNAKRTVTWPDPGYYAAVGFCLAFAALAIIATFRTARRTTAITETRFE